MVEILAAFAQVDENSIQPEDLVRHEDGGFLDEDQLLAFLDEVEGEFGIELHQPEQEAVATVEDLLDMLSDIIEERMVAERDMV